MGQLDNFAAAVQAMQLTPQEQALYQRHLQNLYGPGGVTNPDGSRSTLYQMSTEINGRVYNLPTVYDGKILSPPDAMQRAQAQGLNNFPSYGSEQEAEARYQQMHQFMEKDTAAYLAQQKTAQPAAAPTTATPPPAAPTTRLQGMNAQ
jgi:hypothetical protein